MIIGEKIETYLWSEIKKLISDCSCICNCFCILNWWFLLFDLCSSIIELNMSSIMRKPAFCICENKDADQLHGNRENQEAAQPSVFTTQILQSLFFLNTKLQDSSHLLRLYSQVYVGPGGKPGRQVFWRRGSYGLLMDFCHTSTYCNLPLMTW